MKVAIIVLNYNAYEDTKKYVNKIKEYDVINKIVIVDNLSTDGMYDKLLELRNEKIDVISSRKKWWIFIWK